MCIRDRGNSVGLSPFWTLLAVLLGGKLFGVLGMIFFIPLMALVTQLLHESIERRLHTRKPELSNVPVSYTHLDVYKRQRLNGKKYPCYTLLASRCCKHGLVIKEDN